MAELIKIKNRLLNKIPLTHRKRLEKVIGFFSAKLRRSLKPPFPSTITIDPIDACNLKCPLCPNGLRLLNNRPKVMSLETFKLIVDKIPGVEHICLFNWGEPFLNPVLFKMIKYAHGRDIRVTIHSNFSLKVNNDFFTNIFDSGLDTLVISLDGASQPSFSKYRVGGDFDLVFSNIKKLVRMKKERGKKSPLIVWKFIVNRFNENEIDAAKNMANRLGIEFETAYLGLSDDLPGVNLNDTLEQRKRRWLPKNKKYQQSYYRNEYKKPLMNSHCTNLFGTMIINPDGKVLPCCWVTDEKYVFGDLIKESFEDIWYNSKYLYSRSLFLKAKYSGSKEKTVCLVCDNYKKIP